MSAVEEPRSGEDATAEVLRSLAEVVELRSVLVSSFSAQRVWQGRPSSMAVTRDTSYAVEADRLLYRISVRCSLLGPSRRPVESAGDSSASPDEEVDAMANLKAEFVCDLTTTNAYAQLTDEVLTRFGNEFVYEQAFPYIREIITSMSVRLGFPPITVGALHRGQPWPDTASLGIFDE